MKTLGRRANMEDRDVIRYIIKGVSENEGVRMTLRTARNFEELSDQLDDMDESFRSTRDGKPPQAPTLHDKGRTVMSKPARKDHSHGKCYSCGGEGHKSSDCPHKALGPKCFKCSLFGHVSKSCPKRESGKLLVIGGSGNRSTLRAIVAGQRVRCQMDSGADFNLIRQDFYDSIKDSASVVELKASGGVCVGAGGLAFTATGQAMVPTLIDGN